CRWATPEIGPAAQGPLLLHLIKKPGLDEMLWWDFGQSKFIGVYANTRAWSPPLIGWLEFRPVEIFHGQLTQVFSDTLSF
ncbi:MAG: hypothetical protein LBV29_09100, partial [Azoarcus sp.]|nr:hypothetical protein [Azoarcus sp.]